MKDFFITKPQFIIFIKLTTYAVLYLYGCSFCDHKLRKNTTIYFSKEKKAGCNAAGKS